MQDILIYTSFDRKGKTWRNIPTKKYNSSEHRENTWPLRGGYAVQYDVLVPKSKATVMMLASCANCGSFLVNIPPNQQKRRGTQGSFSPLPTFVGCTVTTQVLPKSLAPWKNRHNIDCWEDSLHCQERTNSVSHHTRKAPSKLVTQPNHRYSLGILLACPLKILFAILPN